MGKRSIRYLLLPLLAVMLVCLAGSALRGQSRGAGKPAANEHFGLPAHNSPYYTIYTDLQGDDLRETNIRMTRMVELYQARTKDFSGTIRQRLPFYLFRKSEDYFAAGAPRGSAGVYMGSALMAIAGERVTQRTWHVVQHEGFHQFCDAVIGGNVPIWINEGLAEYFGEAIFTGDNFVSGVIPKWRLQRVRKQIQNKQFKSIQDMMLLGHRDWNAELDLANYDQAWSMAHFLAHGDDGRYQKAFGQLMVRISKGTPWMNAWAETFGEAEGFEERWRAWWLALPDHPTEALYAQATLEILTSHLARAVAQKQTFDNFEEFRKSAEQGTLKIAEEDWLPPALLKAGLKDLNVGEWSIDARVAGQPRLVLKREDQTRLIGSYKLVRGRVQSIAVEIDDLAPKIAETRALLSSGKRDSARLLLQDAIRRNPQSPHLEEARELARQTR